MARYLFAAEGGAPAGLAELHPATIMTCCLCMVVAIFSTVSFTAYLVMLAMLAAVILGGRLPLKSIGGIILVVVPLCFFITLIQALNQPGEALFRTVVLGREFAFSGYGVKLGLAITLRVILLALTMSIFMMLVHPSRMTRALYDAGMPFKYAYAFTLALRFLPLILGEISTISNAQKCRGYDIDRSNFFVKAFKIIPLMTPLIITCLRRASSIALAMDLKAFGSVKNRTFYVELAGVRPFEKAIMAVSCVAAVSFAVVSAIA